MFFLIVLVACLSLLILSGIAMGLWRFRAMEKRLMGMERDLRQFYRDLGRPKAEIINIREGKRPS